MWTIQQLGQRVKAALDVFRGRLNYPNASWVNWRIQGVPVTQETALTLSAYFSCVRIIAETIGVLDWRVYEAVGARRLLRADHPNDVLLRLRPNADMGSANFREAMLFWLLNWGNAYAEIQMSNGPWISGLWPVPSWAVTPNRDANGNVIYEVSQSFTGEAKTPVPADRMLHWRGLSLDGIVGLSTLQNARLTLGVSLAMDGFQSNFYSRGALLSGVLEHPGRLNEPAAKKIRESWQEIYGGVVNAGKVAVLEEGMKFNSFTMPLKDAEFIASRKFQTQEIARWFRMPLHKLGDLSDAKYANIEQQQIEFVNETIKPWTKRILEETNYKIFGGQRFSKFYSVMDTNELTQGDMESRYNAYSKARQWGWMSANDVLRAENKNELPAGAGGDLYLWPANMIPQSQAEEYFEKQPDTEPAPAGPPAPADQPEGDDEGQEPDELDLAAAGAVNLRATLDTYRNGRSRNGGNHHA